jgi:osmoprotectant transport system permease protein
MDSILEVFQRPDFLAQLVVHIELSVIALLIGITVAMPVALLVYRSRLWSAVAINTGNIGRAVPSLAILALVFPLLGFGFAPSLVALTLLAIPPILINASTGLRQVNPQIIDAARGMGLSNGRYWDVYSYPSRRP